MKISRFFYLSALILISAPRPAAAAPEIIVEAPSGSAVADGGTKNFGGTIDGTSIMTFKVRNTGPDALNLTGAAPVTITGANAGDFILSAQPAATVSSDLAPVTITNAGFEAPAIAPASILYTPPDSGWSFGNWAGVASNGSSFYYSPAREGRQVAFLYGRTSGAVISRAVTFPGAGKYTFCFLATRRDGTFPADDITVQIDGTTIGVVTAAQQIDSDWHTYSYPYTSPGAGTRTLSFTGTGAPQPTGMSSVFDDVRISGWTTFNVTFTPQGVGTRTAILRIASNDSDEGVYDINLTATGLGTAGMAIEEPAGTPLATGTVTAWGVNDSGQTNVPAGLSSVTAIAAGGRHNLALNARGTVAAWGWWGQNSVPAGLSNVVAVAAGYNHCLALKGDGTVVGWGANVHGERVPPAGLSNVIAIAAGGQASVAVKSDGTVVEWGRAEGTVQPAGLTGVKAVARGEWHTVALKTDGTVVCWGVNDNQQCNAPAGLTNVVAIAAGGENSVALKSDGTIVRWGKEPVPMPAGLKGIRTIATSWSHTLTLRSDSTVTAWGDPIFNLINVPAGLSGVRALSAGGYLTAIGSPAVTQHLNHSLALKDSTVDFGSRVVGGPSLTKTFTVKSNGTGNLHIPSVSTVTGDGGDASDFTVSTSGMLGEVSAGAQTTFTVKFAPLAAGTRRTTLRVTSDDLDTPSFYINLMGTATAPEIAVEQPVGSPIADAGARDFGSSNIGSGKPLTFTLKNTGIGDLVLSGTPRVAVSGTHASEFAVTAQPADTVAAAGSVSFTVTFTPGAASTRTALLTIASNDPNESPYRITVTGTGIVPLTALESWRQTHFGITANTGNAADAFDFDKDGLTNLTEFAFGLDPKNPASSTLPQAQFSGVYYTLIFNQPAGVSGITYRGQWTSTLQANDWQTVGDTGTGGQHIFRIPFAAYPRAFMRVLITVP